MNLSVVTGVGSCGASTFAALSVVWIVVFLLAVVEVATDDDEDAPALFPTLGVAIILDRFLGVAL